MNPNDLPDDLMASADALAVEASFLLSPLLSSATRGGHGGDTGLHGVVIGELLALGDDRMTPLVRFPGQAGDSAIAGRSSIDLQPPHIGRSVVLVFEQGDPARPIVVGVLRGAPGWPLADKPAQVEVDADGQRLLVSAKEQLVLRCGKASITLTKAGKVLIEGAYLLSRSTGVNRIKGGSVQLN